MNILLTLPVALLALCLAGAPTARADDDQPLAADEVAQESEPLFTAAELDDLLAPIALYPDPLLAQVLPAATFVVQIDEAARYVRQYGSAARIDDQPWDVSVRAVAHYPDVLFMMDQKYDWTASVGQAYVNQPQDVMDAIQRLRGEARDEGNLVSTPQQQVIVEDGYIRIVPAEPAVIYVPQYDPLVVYAEPPPAYGFITFGVGFTIGAWLNRDCDWHGHRVYYHGWRGGGWIGRSRPYIKPRRNVYINNTYRDITVDRRVVRHDTTRYRQDLHRGAEYRRERTGRPVPPRTVAPAPRPTTPVAPTPRATAPVTPTPPPPSRPEATDAYRGRVPRGGQPAPQTGYGGYGSGKDAATYRERGQSSRDSMRQFSRPQPQPRPLPVQRPAPSGGRQAAPPPPRPAPPPPRPAPPAGRSGGGQGQRR